ncbi:MAG: anion transporter [Deltaproteobacteria bacterium]|nr:anion transporter [Deltaproteobacteria bacterium]
MQEINIIPPIILAVVFVLITIRQVGNIRLAIWQIMLMGAVAALATGSIGVEAAGKSIDLDVMIFLFCMFAVGEAMVESGYLKHLAYGLFRRARSVDSLVLFILFIMGFFSAFLMNDTIAIIGTPLVLYFAGRYNISHKLMLLSLCFAATLGSVASPIGNPQNLLIALSGNVADPFVTFLKWLAVPTVLNLFLAYGLLRLFFRKEFHSTPITAEKEPVTDREMAALCRLSLIIIFALVGVKVLSVTLGLFDLRLTWIAVAAAAPILFLSPRRAHILRRIDWHTLVFFAAMFVLMEAVWASNFIQSYMPSGPEAFSTGAVLASGALASQLLSNVPFVALYLPVLDHLGAPLESYMALAAGSTIAGNLFILGAASNVIVIQTAEKRGGKTLSFVDFALVGIPLTALNVLVYWLWFSLM